MAVASWGSHIEDTTLVFGFGKGGHLLSHARWSMLGPPWKGYREAREKCSHSQGHQLRVSSLASLGHVGSRIVLGHP